MSAYMIVFAKISDRQPFIEKYAVPAAKLVAQYGGEYVVRAPGVEAKEGGMFDGQSVVISKWPDKAAINAFWESAEYQKLKEARAPYSEAHVMVVEEPA
ncbi:DUF1330 domain-containing protein [Hirschia litorea]|uniref:DUF1330 domain-containing protein n=1 Tax=Hirschia litorea TaxID=1199156 RepID=A0ABW2IGQ0_9PROT